MNERLYHYTESGLINVFIHGVLIEKDDAGEDIVTIPAVNKLHKVIAEGIVLHAKGMDGSELRFLRTEMGMTQSELARLVHRDKQSIGRWERNEQEIDSNCEVIIRLLAIKRLELHINVSIEEISQKSITTAELQEINIQMKDSNDQSQYELMAA